MAVFAAGLGAAEARADPTIAAAGDVACDPASAFFNGGAGDATHCRQAATSALLDPSRLSLILALGDLQYNAGTLANFQASYDPAWGPVKLITRPAIGNHEYEDPGATGYFDYFNGVGNATGPAGDRSLGYYSYDIVLSSGAVWHLVSLNSQCADPDAGVTGQLGACAVGSGQEQWLRADLAAHPTACTLAYWHHPTFNSSILAEYPQTAPLWQALQDARADLVLTGHAHFFERFAPQDANGVADPAGIREFVVGTGGHSHFPFGVIQPNSEARQSTTFGVLELSLHDRSYDWRFVPEAGASYSDSGSAACTLPSNAFRFGKLKRNRRRGTATLPVIVPNPGTVALYGKRVRKVQKGPRGAGSARLRIRLKPHAKRRLDPVARTKIKVSYTPDGGDTNSKSKRIKLIKRR
jgi:acid phosphatase type 7